MNSVLIPHQIMVHTETVTCKNIREIKPATLPPLLCGPIAASFSAPDKELGRIAQLVACLIQEPEVQGSIPSLATYFRFSFR